MMIMRIWTKWPMWATVGVQIAMFAQGVRERQQQPPSCLKRAADTAAARGGSERVANSCKW